MNQLVCYCFGYSKEDIIRDMQEHEGRSEILQKIMESKQSGSCNCEVIHPEHR